MSLDENGIIPARMLNEYAYCPRLGYLMWVDGVFADSADTVHGRFVHRNVDKEPKRARKAPPVQADEVPSSVHHRSVLLTGESCGLTAKIDLVEAEGTCVTPVDYKRSKRPHTPHDAWEPERVQLCAQGLILRENGFSCDEGVLYFAGSGERVAVTFDDTLVARTLELAEAFRTAAAEGVTPEPLADSPKCPRCSLAPLCLPDEVRSLTACAGEPPRRLFPARDDALPLYVSEPRARIGKDGDTLVVRIDDSRVAEARLAETSSVVLFGSAQISTQAVQSLCERGIPVCYLSSGGWFYGTTHGLPAKNVDLRRSQYRAADDPARCLALARRFVAAKVANQRTLLRRNHPSLSADVLDGLKRDVRQSLKAPALESLLGVEGTAARRYFGEFAGLFKGDGAVEFTLEGRNKRPPKDPVNALLSFGYAVLTREWTTALHLAGLDPYLGFYHQPRHGKPALALDLMEEFRPLVVDSAVVTAVNNGEVGRRHFIEAMGVTGMTPEGRRAFMGTLERRLAQEITHPVFGYAVSYRRVFEVQARLLGRYLVGEIPHYPAFTTR